MTPKKSMDKLDHRVLVERVLDRYKLKSGKKSFEHDFSKFPKFDRLGEPIDECLWDILFNDSEYLCVDKTVLEEGEIDTLWSGYDLISYKTLNKSEKPYIFTTIFQNLKGENLRFFYTDIDAAFYNHEKLVFMADQKMFQHVEE